jgi:hypothetical protein
MCCKTLSSVLHSVWDLMRIDANPDQPCLQVAQLQAEKQQMRQRCSALELENANLQVWCIQVACSLRGGV